MTSLRLTELHERRNGKYVNAKTYIVKYQRKFTSEGTNEILTQAQWQEKEFYILEHMT